MDLDREAGSGGPGYWIVEEIFGDFGLHGVVC